MLLFDIHAWWEVLTISQKIYWCFAIPSSLAFLIIFTMTFMGGDMDDASDFDHDMGFQFFTIKGLTGFFVVFSWTGLLLLDSGYSSLSTTVIAVISGIVMMTIMAAIFYYMSKLTDDGTLQLNNAIGKIGEVYLTLEPNRSSLGQVQINVQGSIRTLQAMTDEDTSLPQGTVIEVTEIINSHILLVKKHK